MRKSFPPVVHGITNVSVAMMVCLLLSFSSANLDTNSANADEISADADGNSADAKATAAEKLVYENDILPVLQKYCVGCHSADDPQSGLALDSFAALAKGGDSGAAITKGVAASSRMYLMAAGKMEPVMPPDDAEGLTPLELEQLEKWIDQGALSTGKSSMPSIPIFPQVTSSENVEQPVTAIAVSPHGDKKAIARFGKVELVRTDDSNAEPTVVTGDFGKINSLQFSSDAKKLVVGSGTTGAAGLAVMIDLESGEIQQRFEGHRDILYAAEFSPDQSLIATAGYDREIKLWNAKTGEERRRLIGHNGAIYSLAFSPDGKFLASACADETVKIWRVDDGQRMDTLSQPEGEVNDVQFTPDGKQIVAISADNRLRVWDFVSKSKPAINPLKVTRFIDESSLVSLAFSPTGDELVIAGRAGNLKRVRRADWLPVAVLDPVDDAISDMQIDGGKGELLVSLMDGRIERRSLEPLKPSRDAVLQQAALKKVWLDLGPPKTLKASDLNFEEGIAKVPRNVTIQTSLTGNNNDFQFRFQARKGEAWTVMAVGKGKKRIDPIVEILDAQQQPILRARLQAVRDTYFTFRGKNSTQTNDFRLFRWEEIGLNQYLYSSGEVTKTYRHPRGPDSGFDVYPARGSRWTYFGTTATTHALGEPAYVVRELGQNESPEPNGLPVFDLYYRNDDDPAKQLGNGAKIHFVAPDDGEYIVAVQDSAGRIGDGMDYELSIHPTNPAFKAKASPIKLDLLPGTGREFSVSVDRIDGFMGPIEFRLDGLPEGVVVNSPLVIQAEQTTAVGMLWIPADFAAAEFEPTVVATADVIGRRVEQDLGSLGKLKVGSPPSVTPTLMPVDRDVDEGENWTLRVKRGQTGLARIKLRRSKDANGEVRFGNADSGRNAAHGVYVDNIGLSGLLVLPGADEREVFITVDPVAELGPRSFFVKSALDKGVTSQAMTVWVEE